MSGPRRPSLRGWTLFAVAFIGITLVQLAWALVVPPFRGSDEHDHAFRAGAVARGEWLPDYTRVDVGRGEIVTPPGDLVTAAEPVCTWLVYTKRDDCHAIAEVGDGRVQVGSAAARYNPAYYWLMGTAARPWHGSEALYAMRALGAIVSGLLLAVAITVTRRWAGTIWPGAALLVVLTPTATYTTSVAAPNGVELGGAILLWSCLLGLIRAPLPPRRSALLVAGAAVGAIPLLTVRSMGPLWFGLILGTWLLLSGAHGRRAIASAPRPQLIGAALVTACALAAGVAWTLAAGTNDPGIEPVAHTASPWPYIPGQVALWPFQVVSAVPLRNDPSPMLVYALGLSVFLLLAGAGWKFAHARVRVAMAVTVVLSVVVPVILTVVAFATYGTAWQGRYGWPYTSGLLLMAGLSLELNKRSSTVRVRRVATGAVAATMGTATLIAQLAVLRRELLDGPLAQDPAWITPSSLLVIGLTASGFLLLAIATSAQRSETLPSPEPAPGISAEGNRPLASAHDLAP